MEIGGNLFEFDEEYTNVLLPVVDDQFPTSSISSTQLTGKEVEEAIKRGIEDSIPNLVQAVTAGIIQAVIPELVEEITKRITPTIPLPLRSLTLPSCSRSSVPRKLRLKIEGQQCEELFTLKNLREQGVSFTVSLHDDESGVLVNDGDESSLRIKIVVLHGDFKDEDTGGLPGKDFSYHIVEQREGKRPLLVGTCELRLRKGVACIGDFMFTDNSSWTKSKKFKLGAKVVGSVNSGVNIREGVSEAFKVKERRGESYRKKETPSLSDLLWRLPNIGKNGQTQKRLEAKGIYNVKDFLELSAESLKEVFRGQESKIRETTKFAAKALAQNGTACPYEPYGANCAFFADGNQTDIIVAAHGPNSQMSLSTEPLSPAAISSSANMHPLDFTANKPAGSEMQQRFSNSSANMLLSSESWDFEDILACVDTQNQASRKWCVVLAAKWVISLRRIIATRPLKKQKICPLLT